MAMTAKMVISNFLDFCRLDIRLAMKNSQLDQNKYKIPGVPSWAININCPVDIAINDAKMPTLGLNQFLSNKIIPIADKNANMIDANLMLKTLTPNIAKLAFCNI